MGFGIEFGIIAVSVLFWKLGWALDNFRWLPQATKPYVPAIIAGAGAFTFSISTPASWLIGILGWVSGVIPGGGIIIACVTIWLVWLIIRGLSDGQLDPKDVAAIAIFPIVSFSLGGPIGSAAGELRQLAQVSTMNFVSMMTGT